MEARDARDQAVLGWIAEQTAVRTDLLRHLVGAPAPVSEGTVRRWVERWRAAGLVERRRFLAGQPAVVWLTHAGLRLVGRAARSRVPAVGQLAHLHAVGLVRLGVEAAGGRGWVGERALRRAGRDADAHRPDGRFRAPGGVDTAVEVELTVKGARRLHGIVDDLTLEHDAVLYVVGSDPVRAAVERAVDALDEHDRVTLVDLAAFALPRAAG